MKMTMHPLLLLLSVLSHLRAAAVSGRPCWRWLTTFSHACGRRQQSLVEKTTTVVLRSSQNPWCSAPMQKNGQQWSQQQ